MVLERYKYTMKESGKLGQKDAITKEYISAVTNSKLKYPEGKEVVDVCAAIEKMKMDSRIEGRIEGKIEGKMEGEIKGSVETYKEVAFSLQDTIQRVAAKFDLSLQKSEEEVRKYWK